jgi:endonuclease/exonuclease/phosphatase family metal-dependent hydrolase
MKLRIATWNVERSGSSIPGRVPLQRAHLESLKADIYVLTECHGSFELGDCAASVMSSSGRPPYTHEDRAVGVWSRWPILATRETDDPRLTVCAETATPAGRMLVYGTVLPYHADGAPAAGSWERHRRALAQQIAEWRQLRQDHPDHLMCVAGDFNMNLDGRKWYGDAQSRTDLLAGLNAAELRCVTTEDWQAQLKRSSIEHICIAANLQTVGPARAWSGDGQGRSRDAGSAITTASSWTSRRKWPESPTDFSASWSSFID